MIYSGGSSVTFIPTPLVVPQNHQNNSVENTAQTHRITMLKLL